MFNDTTFEEMFNELQQYTEDNLFEMSVGEFIEMWILLQKTKEEK